MLHKPASALPLSILLFIRPCYGQQASSFPSSPLTPGSALRTIGNSTYTLLCEQVDQNALSPYVSTHLATDIRDIDACMALCDSFGQTCEIALWDITRVTPCTLLTAVPLAQAPPPPGGKCYAAKINGSPPVSISAPVSFAPAPESTSLSIPLANLSLSGLLSTTASEDISSTTSTAEYDSTTSTDASEATSTSTSSESDETTSSSTEDASATTMTESSDTDVAPTSTLVSTQPERTNLLCGPAWPDITLRDCPQSDANFGRCCSRFGFCGNETAFCGYGCLSGFGSCEPPLQDQPIQVPSYSSSSSTSSTSISSLSTSSSLSAPSQASTLPFPVWSAIPYYDTYYWLPAPPVNVWPSVAIPSVAQQSVQPLQPSIGIVPSPFFISHAVPFSSPEAVLPAPSFASVAFSEMPVPVLSNSPVLEASSSGSSSALLLATFSVHTPKPVLPNPPVIDVSSGAASSSDIAGLAISAVASIEPLLPTDLASAPLSVDVASNPLSFDFGSGALSIDVASASISILTEVSVSDQFSSVSSFVSPLPNGPNPPVVDPSSFSSPFFSASATVSFVA
ncbi:Chitin-binding type 1 [Macrophomina phaseolina MS6]|uniref:Chitin-binding type 1 n=1 Tax=Macrophomina phaseolina (strain MS6) TaxID=1126212 RepID=K2SDT8_MACPH|nr:Chitin-binding type 1 [Macrophomina phaseolina MS6]